MRRGKGADTFTNFVRHRVSLKIGTLNIYFSFRFPLSTGFPVRAGARPPHHPAPGQFRHFSRDWWGDHTLSQQNFGLLSRNSLSESSASLSESSACLSFCKHGWLLFGCLSTNFLHYSLFSLCMSLYLPVCLTPGFFQLISLYVSLSDTVFVTSDTFLWLHATLPNSLFLVFSAFLSIFCHSLPLSDILSLWFVWLSTCRSFPRLQYFSLKFSLLGFHDKYCMSELNSGEGVCFSPQKATIAEFRDVSSNITKE